MSNRTIKFRAWDTRKEIMRNVMQIKFNKEGNIYENPELISIIK